MKNCKTCKYYKNNTCYNNNLCIERSKYEEKIINESSVKIILFNNKNGKVLYENLGMEQLEHILKVLDPKGWN